MPDVLQKWKNTKQLETTLLTVLWKFLPSAFHSCLVFVFKHEAFFFLPFHLNFDYRIRCGAEYSYGI